MSSRDLKKRVDFDLLRYANCWEDAEVLLAGLSPEKGSAILSIASAGDNSFSLLTTDPAMVVAVDISPTQLHLTELKKKAISKFDRASTLEFLGFEPSVNRKRLFDLIKTELNSETRAYWESHISELEAGIVHQGKFERYFQLFSRRVLPLIHSRHKIEALLRVKSQEAQKNFYDDHWDSWRWRLLFRVFFSRFVMGKYGRDPEFLRQVQGSVSQIIYNKAAAHLESAQAQNNYILRYALTGDFGSLLPHYLQGDNYEKIQTNIDRLYTYQGYAQKAIQVHDNFDYMNLSNIFEYMDEKEFLEIAKLLVRGTKNGGKLAYWNLMVPRRISKVLPETAKYVERISNTLTSHDRGFFYKEFIVDRIDQV